MFLLVTFVWFVFERLGLEMPFHLDLEFEIELSFETLIILILVQNREE